MKRFFILIPVLVFLGYTCPAQDASIKKPSDSSGVKEKAVTAKSSNSPGVSSDTSQYALLYVYRPRNFTGSAISYDIKLTNSVLNKSYIGRINNNSKFVVKLYQEGKTEIFASTESTRSVLLNVKFGQKYYLKCGVTTGIIVGRPELNLVYPEQGELDYLNVRVKAK